MNVSDKMFQLIYLNTNAGINFIHNHPRAPPGICSKNLPLPWAFASWLLQGGWGLVGVAPEGWEFVCKPFFPFLEIPLQWQELATDNTLGFVALKFYVLKENYSLKLKNHFSDQRLRM